MVGGSGGGMLGLGEDFRVPEVVGVISVKL